MPDRVKPRTPATTAAVAAPPREQSASESAVSEPGAGQVTVSVPRAPERRRRSTLRSVLAALTTGTALLGISALVAAASIIPPVGARRTARLAAEQELRTLLAPDERIVAATFASQRRWTDVWRESFGLVAATTRRVLYVGAPPTPLLRPREDGPMELLVESYPYEASFLIEPRELFFGQLRGLALRTPLAQVDFVISSSEWNAALAVAQAAVTTQRRLTIEAENQESFNRAPQPQGEVYVPYVVRRGETLSGLARRLRTTPDVLRQLNQLRDDNIKVGQRIRVPRGPMVDSVTPPS